MLLGDIPSDGTPIPSPFDTLVVSVIFLLLSAGADFLIIFAVLRDKGNLHLDMQIIMSLVVGDFLFAGMQIGYAIYGKIDIHVFVACLVVIVYLTFKLYNQIALINNSNWVIGKIGCFWDATIVIITFGVVIASLFLLTLNRYLALIQRIHMSQKQVTIAIISIWVGLIGLVSCFIPVNNDPFFSLQPSRLYCFIATHSSEPFNIIAAMLILCFIVATMAFIVYAWTVIVLKYIKLINEKSIQNEFAPDGPRELTKMEVRLIKKALLIAGTFVFCWSFIVAKILYELITETEGPVWLDHIVVFMACLEPIVNALILYTYDANIRQNIDQIFRVFSFIKLNPRSLSSTNRAKAAIKVDRKGGERIVTPVLQNGNGVIQLTVVQDDTATKIIPGDRNLYPNSPLVFSR